MHKGLILLAVVGAGVGCTGSTQVLDVAHYQDVCGPGLCLRVSADDGRDWAKVQGIDGYAFHWGMEDRVRVAKDESGYHLLEVISSRSMSSRDFTVEIDRASVTGGADSFKLGGERAFGCDDANLCKWIEKKLDLGESFHVEFAHGEPLRALQVL